jgi:hypothetical protein
MCTRLTQTTPLVQKAPSKRKHETFQKTEQVYGRFQHASLESFFGKFYGRKSQSLAHQKNRKSLILKNIVSWLAAKLVI